MLKRYEPKLMLLEDRHHGAFSGGKWLVIEDPFVLEGERTRILKLMDSGLMRGEGEAMLFWQYPPRWIAAGDSPAEALENLSNGLQNTIFK